MLSVDGKKRFLNSKMGLFKKPYNIGSYGKTGCMVVIKIGVTLGLTLAYTSLIYVTEFSMTDCFHLQVLEETNFLISA